MRRVVMEAKLILSSSTRQLRAEKLVSWFDGYFAGISAMLSTVMGCALFVTVS